jgi:heme exporter protein C
MMLKRLLKDPFFLLFVTKKTARFLLITSLLLLPVSLVVSLSAPAEALQGQSVLYLFLHVPAVFSCFFLYSMMSAAAIITIVWRIKIAYMLLESCLPLCFFMAALTLTTGALWGKMTWGTYWIWDARLTSFLFLTLYLGLLMLIRQHPRFNSSVRGRHLIALLVLIGVMDLIFVHYSVQWFKTLHQPPSFSLNAPPTMDADFLIPLILSTLCFMSSSVAIALTQCALSLTCLLHPIAQRLEVS